MSRAIIAFLCLAAWPAAGRPIFGGGLGFATRVQREVNPDYAETKSHPQIFTQMLFLNWGAHAELSAESQSSSSGLLNVTSRSINAGVWARYKFLEAKRWRPFASAGAGLYFDRVRSEFGAATNESRGHRPYMGAGGGVAVIYWDHLLLEAEARATVVRERKEPMISALFRVGFLF